LLKDRHFDIVICDFNLGVGQDGQQLLEEMRTTKAITHLTQWVIVTAETSKDMVMGAVEFQPDDYLAKPFAFDTFKLRLDKWVRRINDLAPFLTALDKEDSATIVATAQSVIDHQPRYRAWARRMLVSTWIENNELDTAETYLNEILQKRQQDWAMFELARIQMRRGEFTKAALILQEVISTNPNNVGAYDQLARCYFKLKQLDKAQHTLIRGIQISPRNLHRQRHLAEISRELQDYPVATKAFKEVLTLATYSRHESPDHYINLAETLNTAARKGTEQDLKNPSQQALQTAQKMSQRYNEEMPLQLKSRMIQAESLDIQGLTSARDGELTKLHSMAMRHVDEIKPDLALAIAGTHYRFEKQHIGDEWVDALRQHHANDNDFQQKLLMSQSEPVSVRAKKRAAEHNGLGNQAYKSGDFVAALSHFSKALEFS
ncbi:MAG: tetratricopeptide repeat protein, partial [Natronospirillum sp.]